MNLFQKEQLAIELNRVLAHERPETVLICAAERYPNITFACSFGAEDVILVDMLQKHCKTVPIFYLDTDFHFPETYSTRDHLAVRYETSFIRVMPKLSPEQQAEKYGDELWKSDPNACCGIRKVEPLSAHLSMYDAWITGIRKEQSPTRANARIVEYDTKFGMIKFNPLVDWTSDDVWQYIREHDLPYNPLHNAGYPSIGCHYCTRPVASGEDPRAGRWSGFAKTECGLHQ